MSAPAKCRPGWADTRTVAEYTGFAYQTLCNWRSRRFGPRSHKVAGGAVRYKLAEVDAWLEANPEHDHRTT